MPQTIRVGDEHPLMSALSVSTQAKTGVNLTDMKQ